MSAFTNPKTLTIDQLNLVYYRMGVGPALLMVHGITTYSFIWRKLVPLLQDKYELILVDLAGCGDADKSLGVDLSLKHHAKVLCQMIRFLNIDRLHLVGHDVGGGICQIMAVSAPQLFCSLTLINTVAYDFWPVQPIISMRTPIIRQLAMACLDIGALRFIVRRGMYHPERVTKELMAFFWHPLKTSEGRKAFLYFAHCLNNKDLLEISDQISELAIPVLIVRGDADVYLSQSIAEKLHANIPGSRYELLSTAGHFIQEDEPEQLAYIMSHFIEQADDHRTK